ncbi:MAG: transposase [Verrucomicrobiia bacterium]
MRQARLKVEGGEGIYHCMSRVVEGRFLFDMRAGVSVEAEYFVGLMRRLEAFCGVQVLTYALMSNHFHLLVRVPGQKPQLSDEELVERVRQLNGERAAMDLDWLLNHLRGQDPEGRSAQALKDRYLVRMCDVSVFLKELKGRFTQWFNRRHERYGVLWAERFKSVLVEGSCEGQAVAAQTPEALTTMAAYIDLNAVRAGLCEDPKEYRYCGYGEAVSGRKEVRQRAVEGLAWVMGSYLVGNSKERSKEALLGYRRLLFGAMLERVEGGRIEGESSAEKARAVLKAGGRLSRAELLRCRVRYFSDGLVLGSREFVEGVFEAHRGRFGEKRKSGGRRIRGDGEGKLYVLRDLRKSPIG